MCQRYYEQSYDIGTVAGTNTTTGMTNLSIASDGSSNVGAMIVYKVQKRAAPTITAYTSGGTSGSWSYERSGVGTTSTSVTVTFIGQYQCAPYSGVGASWVPVRYYGHWTASAEL